MKYKASNTIINEEGSKFEVLDRIAQATAELSSLKTVWRDCNITLRSVWIVFSWYRSSCMQAKPGHSPPASTQNTSNGDEMLPQTHRHIVYRARHKWGVTQQDQSWNWHIRRLGYNGQKKVAEMVWQFGVSKTILQWTVNGCRRRGGQRRRWEEEWMGLSVAKSLRASKDRKGWRESDWQICDSAPTPTRGTWDRSN